VEYIYFKQIFYTYYKYTYNKENKNSINYTRTMQICRVFLQSF